MCSHVKTVIKCSFAFLHELVSKKSTTDRPLTPPPSPPPPSLRRPRIELFKSTFTCSYLWNSPPLRKKPFNQRVQETLFYLIMFKKHCFISQSRHSYPITRNVRTLLILIRMYPHYRVLWWMQNENRVTEWVTSTFWHAFKFVPDRLVGLVVKASS